MMYRSRHYRTEDGGWACGRHKRTQAKCATDAVTDTRLVNCSLCHRTHTYKAAAREQGEREQARHAAICEAGFDPNKPVNEMTPEEIAAFVAWQDSTGGADA